MGITSAQKVPFRSISEHFQGSGPGCQQELIWSARGSSFWLPRELIFCDRMGTHFRSRADAGEPTRARLCALSRKPSIAAMLAVTISVSLALFPLSHPPRTACCLIVHAAQRSCSLVPRFSSARFTNFIELPLHTSQVTEARKGA